MTSDNQTDFDILILGAGPAGYACALRAAQLGFRVGVVESRESAGGTCLNIGCIPSKALLHASDRYAEAKNHFARFGIKTGKVECDLSGMMAHKDQVVEANTKGIAFLFKKNKVVWIRGRARLEKDGYVRVGESLYRARHIVIATGSEPVSLPHIPIDEKRILSSEGALSLPKIPQTLAVMGGGYIGLELGCFWARLGARVIVIEYLDRILSAMDGEVSREMQKILSRQGMDFRLETKVSAATIEKKGVSLTLSPAKGGADETLVADYLLVAVGRKPCIQGLGLEDLGVRTDSAGRIAVDPDFQTNVSGIYAIGDVIAGPMLAHKAQDEGVALAERLAGQKPFVDHDLIPGVVYTNPEAAQIGRTEEQLRAAGVSFKAGKFPFSANGRARAMGSTDGFVKILVDSRTDRILGAHIVGAEAGTLIAEIGVAMAFGASAEDIARTSHAHPTLSEAIKEAALAAGEGALHT